MELTVVEFDHHLGRAGFVRRLLDGRLTDADRDEALTGREVAAAEAQVAYLGA